MNLQNKKIVLGVSGSIAAYKSAELVRLLVKASAQVKVILTDAGEKFVTRETLEVLSGAPVAKSFWTLQPGEIGHIELADWCDLLLIAPASADILAKLRAGMADEPLLAVALATKSPIMVAPAMNVNMLGAAATQENLEVLMSRGVTVVAGEAGELACGWIGAGRMAEPAVLVEAAVSVLTPKTLKGKKICIVTGPTQEAIDAVRYITNASSGKMGAALAKQAVYAGAEVQVISGPVAVPYPAQATVTRVTSAAQMYEAAMRACKQRFDVMILCAAVADVTPVRADVKGKIKKAALGDAIQVTRTKDILAAVGAERARKRSKKPVVVGFTLETNNLVDEAKRKLREKKADLIVANLAHESIGLDTNSVVLVTKDAVVERPAANKALVAQDIYNFLEESLL